MAKHYKLHGQPKRDPEGFNPKGQSGKGQYDNEKTAAQKTAAGEKFDPHTQAHKDHLKRTGRQTKRDKDGYVAADGKTKFISGDEMDKLKKKREKDRIQRLKDKKKERDGS